MPAADLAVRELRAAAAAVSFLTVVPLGRFLEIGPEDVAKSGAVFPLVGALVGAAAAGCGAVLSHAVSGMLAAALALCVSVGLTGALHVDALADIADALGGRTRAQALAIMRDSRVGSYGLVAVVLLMLVEIAALTELLTRSPVPAVALAFALARAVAPVVAAAGVPARPGDGLGATLVGRGGGRAAMAVIVAAILAALLPAPHRAAMLGCAAACAVGAAWVWRARFGGVTGDTLGATIVLSEGACLVVACVR
jgi:adenosylcobinamide-GDP ribazoletransferase